MIPGSPEWRRLITASKVSAILGVSPWQSPRSVWHEMRDETPRDEASDVQKRGHYLEPAILAWWCDRHGPSRYHAQPEYLLGDWAAATPDALAEVDGADVLVEAKSTAYDDDWGDPGTDVIPAYYLVQVYWQMHVSGIHRCYVPTIGPRLRFAEYVVDYDAAIGADLETRMRAFYDSLAADEPPPLDDSVATFDAIRKVHKEIDEGESVAIISEVAIELLRAVRDLDAAEARTRLAKASVLDQMGRAQYAVCEGVRVARRQPSKSGVSFVPLPKNLPLLTDQTEGVAS